MLTPLLVAVLVASSTFAALWPVWRTGHPPDAPRGRRITIVRTIRPGTVVQGCSSLRKRPCPRRRF